ncbi:MAG: NifB/NifX family molybdenum-iron cluster-binding protein [Clostridium sp.]|uniref:NifB/NifX family molybdenum-iron cluster-binding protein n=1 Tax=Clostridium sp. TaxID=1506 RepID=UPI0039EA7659
MSYKIAVASSDGKDINQHFGSAEQFFVYKVEDNNNFKFVELRKAIDFHSKHEDHVSKLKNTIKGLSGCKFVLVTQIGDGALRILRSNGIEVFDVEDSIENALNKVIKYYSTINTQ